MRRLFWKNVGVIFHLANAMVVPQQSSQTAIVPERNAKGAKRKTIQQ
jgi:hypothetical protein